MHHLSKNITNNPTFNTPNLGVSEYFLKRLTANMPRAYMIKIN